MYHKEPVWLSTHDIKRKYANLFEERKFTEPFIGLLFDAHLLRGYYDRKKREVLILEKSWLHLLIHMNYNLYLQIQPVDGEPVKFSIPSYCTNITSQITYNFEKNWYSPSEILDNFERLREENIFTEKFIVQLVQTGILRGKHDSSLKTTYVLLPSFIELLYYRNATIKKNMIIPDDTK
jgi:hypothetical protein